MKSYYLIPMFFTLSCGNAIDSNYIKNQTWQYDSGYKVTKGDFLEFSDRITLKNDSIMILGVCHGIVLEENRSDNELIVKSPKNSEKGVYINSIEFTK